MSIRASGRERWRSGSLLPQATMPCAITVRCTRIQGADPLVAPQAKAKQVELAYACHAPLTVRADRERLDQVLVNPVGNAIMFTRRGCGGHIRIECSPEDGWTRIDVRDTDDGNPVD